MWAITMEVPGKLVTAVVEFIGGVSTGNDQSFQARPVQASSERKTVGHIRREKLSDYDRSDGSALGICPCGTDIRPQHEVHPFQIDLDGNISKVYFAVLLRPCRFPATLKHAVLFEIVLMEELVQVCFRVSQTLGVLGTCSDDSTKEARDGMGRGDRKLIFHFLNHL